MLQGPQRENLFTDATARGIVDTDIVHMFNEREAVQIRARVGERVHPGAVAMPSGWWASANSLTPDDLSDRGGGDFHDTLVEVMPVNV